MQTLVTCLLLAAATSTWAAEKSQEFGNIRGQVLLDERPPSPARGISVTVMDRHGVQLDATITDVHGLYSFTLLPGSDYRLMADLPGYGHSQVDDVQVYAGKTVMQHMTLVHPPCLVVVGALVEEPDIECTISTSRTTYLVGERATLETRLHNRGTTPQLLVYATDGSGRFPRATFRVHGPEWGTRLVMPCNSDFGLYDEDFNLVPPGGSVPVFRHQPPSASGVFHAPGEYTFELIYAASEERACMWGGSVEKWLDRLRHVPTLELECSTTVTVVEQP